MKVLWLTNIELPAARRRHGSVPEEVGGWMESLRAVMSAGGSVQLGVAAVGAEPFEPFVDEDVRYYHLDAAPQLRGVPGVAANWRHRPDVSSLLAQALGVIDDFGPELIHVHGSERPFGLLASACSLPVLVSLQGILIVYARSYFTGVPVGDVIRDVLSLEFAKGRGLVHGCWDMRVAAERELKILQGCSYLAGRTAWDRGIVSVVNPRARYYTAEEILRPEFYCAEWRGRSDGLGPLIYTTLGAAPYKGLVNLLQAVALLRQSAQPSVRLRVSGRIEGTSMWPIARRALDRLGLQGTVDWLGPLSAAEIVSELRTASVYVHPSIVENSPNSLAEAMMLGVPCVSTAAGGVPTLLQDGVEGLLCSPNDVYGLAGAVATVLAEPALAERFGANARRRALKRHDAGAVSQGYSDMYLDIITRHRDGQIHRAHESLH
jgi:glycosyltransferase involved in cell wall biosynthesis